MQTHPHHATRGAAQSHNPVLTARLESLPGVAYATDAKGRIVAYGRGAWDEAAMEGGSPQLADPNTVFGLNVFNSIQDQDNRLIYKGFTKLILAGERRMITFEFRCDAPELGRRLIMHISRAETDHGEPCVVFQSQLLEEVRGVSVPLLARQAHGRLDPSWPVIKICSYCQHFSAPQILGRNDWVSPAEYYDSGGIDEVNLSHGICDQCMKRIVEPQIGAVA